MEDRPLSLLGVVLACSLLVPSTGNTAAPVEVQVLGQCSPSIKARLKTEIVPSQTPELLIAATATEALRNALPIFGFNPATTCDKCGYALIVNVLSTGDHTNTPVGILAVKFTLKRVNIVGVNPVTLTATRELPIPVAPKEDQNLTDPSRKRLPWLLNFIGNLIADWADKDIRRLFNNIPIPVRASYAVNQGIRTNLRYTDLGMNMIPLSPPNAAFEVRLTGRAPYRFLACQNDQVGGPFVNYDGAGAIPACHEKKLPKKDWPPSLPAQSLVSIFLTRYTQ